ncbi:MAG: hypothetical protein COA60_003155 [Robiginitomaculum sp.]|nr:hypothetical protein [Robiginitomaculum sp.]
MENEKMENGNKQNSVLNKLLSQLPAQQANDILAAKVLHSFNPYSRDQQASLPAMFELLFGQRQHKYAMAMVSVLAIVILGGVSGYAGAEVYQNQQDVTDLISGAFSNSSFIFEIGTET